MGNTPCGDMTTSYKVPLNAVNKDYNNFQMIEYTELFHYPSRYPYILSYLRKNGMLFEDMYFPISETRNIVGANLIREQQADVLWKRVNQIKIKRSVKYQEILFSRPVEQYRKPHALYRLLAWVASMPKLVKALFTFDSINQEGLIIVYMPLWGSHDEPHEIVVDDNIPMKNDYDYFFNLPPNCNVATILLEKALAKVLGSYEKVRSHSIVELFQSIVGLPVCVDQLGNREPIEVLSKYYQPNFHLMSYNKKLENHQPEFFKFTIQTEADIALSIWQLLENPHSFQVSNPAQIVMELMKIENERQVIRVGYSSKLYKDKTFLRTVSPNEQKGLFVGRDFLHLQRGNYLLHIYTRTDNVSVNANLIVYSSIPVNLTYRKENYELSGYKKKMAETIFLSNQNNLEKLMNTDRVFSKFIWDGFRGILAFKSEEPTRVKITVLIKEEYRRKIKFEHSDQYEEVVFLKPGSKKIVSFVKFISNDVGNFYSIAINKQENYQYPNPNPMMKKTSSNQSNHSPMQNYPSSSNTPRTGELQSSPFKQQEYDKYEQSSFISESREFTTSKPFH